MLNARVRVAGNTETKKAMKPFIIVCYSWEEGKSRTICLAPLERIRIVLKVALRRVFRVCFPLPVSMPYVFVSWRLERWKIQSINVYQSSTIFRIINFPQPDTWHFLCSLLFRSSLGTWGCHVMFKILVQPLRSFLHFTLLDTCIRPYQVHISQVQVCTCTTRAKSKSTLSTWVWHGTFPKTKKTNKIYGWKLLEYT